MVTKYSLSIYRYNPESNQQPRMQLLEVDASRVRGIMLLDLLKVAKEIDPTLVFRYSCGHGVCVLVRPCRRATVFQQTCWRGENRWSDPESMGP